MIQLYLYSVISVIKNNWKLAVVNLLYRLFNNNVYETINGPTSYYVKIEGSINGKI